MWRVKAVYVDYSAVPKRFCNAINAISINRGRPGMMIPMKAYECIRKSIRLKHRAKLQFVNAYGIQLNDRPVTYKLWSYVCVPKPPSDVIAGG